MANEKQTISIIIADDHKMFLEGLSSLLKQFKEIKIIDTATNGEDVLKLLQTHAPDVVITDINMPVKDGLEATREIREWEANQLNPVENKNILIIGFTATSTIAMEKRCREAGINEILYKPFILLDLIKILAKYKYLKLNSHTETESSQSVSTKVSVEGDDAV